MRKFLFLALLSFGCTEADPNPGKTKADAALGAPVEVVSMIQGSISDGIEGTASVIAKNQVTVRALAGGTLVGLEVDEGSTVKAEEALARIAQPTLVGIVAQARASAAKTKQDLKTAQRLRGEGLVPVQQVEEAQFARKQARHELARLLEERGLGRVASPIDGVVVTRLVRPGEAVTVGTPLLEIADLNALEAHVRVPERNLPRLKVGQPVEVEAEGLGAAQVTGTVTRIAPTVDPKSGTIKVTISVGDGATGAKTVRLRPGMYVRARIVVDTRENAVLVPKRAVIYEDDRAYAFRVHDGKAERLRLELGYADRTRIEVRDPLKVGDQIVVFGHRGLKDDAEVRIVEAPGVTEKTDD